jgi:glycosyltransferase involved in cell wall biosynthesis
MITEKGVFVLLEACRILKAKRIFFECHFVGAWADVTEQSFQQEIKKANLEKCVFAHGPKYGHEKAQYLKNSDIFVFPSYYHNETFGLVNLEAMQYSLPVIATFEGAIPDVVVDGVTGFLVPQRSADKLAGRIQFLIEQPKLREQMGKEGRKRFEELFSLAKFESNFVETLTAAISDNSKVQINSENSCGGTDKVQII